jgi:cytoskeletal protein RodZ
MIGRWTSKAPETDEVKPKGFDDFEVRLGDLMRGERATLGKSLLDVQRELRIRANYIAAIENCDPGAFDTPGFIAGYVRSYARYLGMNPDMAFELFCKESGFSLAHGMSAEASSIRKTQRVLPADRDPIAMPATPFIPARESWLSRVEPGAIGSIAVLIALIGTLGFGGWTVLNEIQRVTFAPVENTPTVLADLDPLAAAKPKTTETDDTVAIAAKNAVGVFTPPTDSLDRIYRPQALDVPVLVARDAPISTLDPDALGTFAAAQTAAPQSPVVVGAPQVNEGPVPELELVAVRPAWVRVRATDGSVIFEGIMEAGDRWVVPALEEAPVLRVGESGAVYFAVNGQHYGPAGPRGTVTSNLALDASNLSETYALADPAVDQDFAKTVADASLVAPARE